MSILEKPLISIIIPVYNVENYLNTCLESVCRQSYQKLEIILIDDGAKDSSGNICDLWKTKDKRIVVIHKENGGLSDARNAGLNLANGQYVMFVDSDDLISTELVSHLYRTLIGTRAQIAICDPVHWYLGSDFSYEPESKCTVYTPEEALCEMMYQNSFLYSAWAKLYDKKLFDDIRFPVGLLFEDVAVMYKLFAKANTIVYSNAKLYGYLHRENSITTKQFSKRDCDIISICQEQLIFAKDYSEPVYFAALAYQVVGALRVYLNAPNTGEFHREIQKCEDIIRKNNSIVFWNKNCRKKLKLSLLLFRLNKALLRTIYAHVDRWK